jgi:N6-L-threonylcarbamoyladenine synthase
LTNRRSSWAWAALALRAEQGDAKRFALPRPLLHSGDLDFSFSGLKTAVRTQLLKLTEPLNEPNVSDQDVSDLAASTQAAIVDVLVSKSLKALQTTGLKRLVVAGGVGANQQLRAQLHQACKVHGVRVYHPELSLCTDNGAMIALAAAMRWQRGLLQSAVGDHAINVLPRWDLRESSLGLTQNAPSVVEIG